MPVYNIKILRDLTGSWK